MTLAQTSDMHLRHRLVWLVPLILGLTVATSARAQTPPSNADQAAAPAATPDAQAPPSTGAWQFERAPHKEYRRYGNSIVLVDGAIILLALVETRALAAMPLTGPLVHLANGQSGRAFASFGLRAGFALVGSLVGYQIGRATGDQQTQDSGYTGFAAGAVGGMVAASAIDAYWLAKKPIPRERRYTVVPQFSVTSERVQLGLSGRF